MMTIKRLGSVDACLASLAAVLFVAWISQSTTFACNLWMNCGEFPSGCQSGAQHRLDPPTYAYYSYSCPGPGLGCCGVSICWWYDEVGHCYNSDMEECVYEGWCWV
jgi:hypothetical protein